MRKHNDEVSIQEIIDDVRRQLSDNGVRITDGLLSFERAWWPNKPDFQTQLLSDRGVLPGPKEVVDEFYAEVLAIQKTIEKHDSAAAAKMDSGDKVMAAADRRARALKFWEQIAFPYRRRGAVVYRIFAPRDIFGSPIVDAMSLDEFIWHISFKLTERLNR